jgi:malate/lactate dehydrogenase
MIVVLVPGGDWYDLASSSEVVAQPTRRVRTKHSTATPETVRKPLIGSIGQTSSPVISQRNIRANNLAQKSEIGQNGLLPGWDCLE